MAAPLREVLDADAQRQRRRTGRAFPLGRQRKGQPHRHALRHIVEGDGRHEQRTLAAGKIRVPLPPQMGQGGVQRGEEADPQQQSCGGRQPAGNAEIRRLLNGGQQQTPHAGRRHDPGGKAQHGPLELGPRFFRKKKIPPRLQGSSSER